MRSGARRGGVVRFVAAGVVTLAVSAALFAGGYALGRRATRVVPVVPEAARPAVVTLRSGTLEDRRPVRVSGEWRTDRAMFGRVAGTVTSSLLPVGKATTVDAGSVLYAVDGRAVVAVPGAVPAFRDIVAGTAGDDVRQIQQFLVDRGLAIGDVDGKWGSATAASWSRWRVLAGLAKSDAVAFGEVLFFASLPATVAATEQLVVGRPVAASDQLVSVLRPVPVLSVATSKEAAASLVPGTKISIEGSGTTIDAVLSPRQTATDSGIRIELDVPDGCGQWCSEVPVGSQGSTWPGTVQVVEPTTGTIVPIGVLRTGAGDGTAVVLADGTTRDVRVLVTVGAEAIVEGVAPGDVVALPGPPVAGQVPSS